jgi:chromatin remodeling complex protein RSC6
MTNNSTGNNTNTMSTPAKSVKKVAKKTEDAPAAAPVAATPEKATKAVPKAVAAPVAVAAVVPEASEVSAPAEATPGASVSELIESLIKSNTETREIASRNLKALHALSKRVAKELKEAGRRRRRARKSEGSDNKEKRPTIFLTPLTLKDELCAFLGKPTGTQMTPADVTKSFSAYIEAHKLKDPAKGHTIHPDAKMRKVLGVKEGEELTYRNVQRYLYKLYVLPEKKEKATA